MLDLKRGMAGIVLLQAITCLPSETIASHVSGLATGSKTRQEDEAAIKKAMKEDPGQVLLVLAQSVLKLQELEQVKEPLDDARFMAFCSYVHFIRLCGEARMLVSGPLIAGCLATSRNPITKHDCCYALGILGYKAASQTIEQVLNDPDPGARANAAWALCEIGEGKVLVKYLHLLEDVQADRVIWEVYRCLQSHLRFSMPPGFDSSQAFVDIRDFGVIKQAAKDLRKRLEEEARVREQKSRP